MAKLGWVLCAILNLSVPLLQDSVLSEHDLKAAYLFNFARHVEWPSDAFTQESSPFVVTVVGQDGMADAVERAMKGKVIQGRSVEVRRSEGGEAPAGSHLVFVSASERGKAETIARGLKGTRSLTVGETPDFIMAGGVISFFIEKKQLRFEVSLSGAKRSGLVVSSKLLRIARVVKSDE